MPSPALHPVRPLPRDVVTHDVEEAVLLGDPRFPLSDRPAPVADEQPVLPGSDRQLADP